MSGAGAGASAGAGAGAAADDDDVGREAVQLLVAPAPAALRRVAVRSEAEARREPTAKQLEAYLRHIGRSHTGTKDTTGRIRAYLATDNNRDYTLEEAAAEVLDFPAISRRSTTTTSLRTRESSLRARWGPQVPQRVRAV